MKDNVVDQEKIGDIGVCRDSDGEDVLKHFYAETISTELTANIIGTPVEIGENRFDNKVLQPAVVIVTGHYDFLEHSEVQEELLKMYENRNYEFYSVVSKSKQGELVVHTDLMMEKYVEREDPDKFNLKSVSVTFKQILVTKKFGEYNPKNPDDFSCEIA